jgi:inhibitor of cysteine peptidase
MEKRIKKQTILYGLIAILSTAFIAGLSFNLGVFLSRTPFITPVSVAPTALFSTFQNSEQLKAFLLSNAITYTPFPFYGPFDVPRLNIMIPSLDAAPSAEGLWLSLSYFSSTNVQVAGVDELDTVKTDGQYIYTLSGTTLTILKAYPPETAEIVSKITFDNKYPYGIFVNDDRLTVIGAEYETSTPRIYSGYYIIDTKTFVNVYDIAIRSNPRLIRELTMTGSYFNSRRINQYVYFVVSQPAYLIYDTIVLPKFYSNGQLVKEIAPTEIHYSNGSDDYFQYTTFIAINTQNTIEPSTYMTLMLGGTSTMYVSLENMYVTIHETFQNTTIYRIHIKENNMTAEAVGEVQGQEVSQFSMDEYDNHLRIATVNWTNGTSHTNLYILNMNLTTAGKLVDIAPGETLDAARFLEKRCYLSTSVVRKDPFFVIDVENASAPEILGYLKIPGFIRYLQSYDENRVIGVGRDELNKVKVSLFDVTNVSAPIELDSYAVNEGNWTDTTVMSDHKALLFDHAKDLLAMPISVHFYGNASVRQSLYVFNITLSDGLVLRGTITHQSAGVGSWDSSYDVKRSLYIDNVLYSVSDKKIKLNDLQNLALIKEIPLP